MDDLALPRMAHVAFVRSPHAHARLRRLDVAAAARFPGVVAVQGVTVTDSAGRYVVEAARGRDVRAEIFALASQQRWRLLELRQVGTTLEEVFMRVVAGEEEVGP